MKARKDDRRRGADTVEEKEYGTNKKKDTDELRMNLVAKNKFDHNLQ